MAKRHRFLVGGAERSVVIDAAGDAQGEALAAIDGGEPLALEAIAAELPGFVAFRAGGAWRRAYVARRGAAFDVTVGARRFVVEPAGGGRRGRSAIGGAEDAPGEITAPLAGVVVEVRVAPGDAVGAGTTVLVLEAMKMQNEVQIPHGGTVTAVHAAPGDSVDRGALLVEYEPAGE